VGVGGATWAGATRATCSALRPRALLRLRGDRGARSRLAMVRRLGFIALYLLRLGTRAKVSPFTSDSLAGGLRYLATMSPDRKRTVRLVVALSAAVVLAGALVYTSFSAASPALTPSQLIREAQPGRSYQLTGTVVAGSVHRAGPVLDFAVADRAGGGAGVPVAYTGTVPDPFREGREVIVTVQKQGAGYVGEPGSLITKCPSKYKVAPPGESQN
jgi:cytochrome c-type biogenesis protein CcmE